MSFHLAVYFASSHFQKSEKEVHFSAQKLVTRATNNANANRFFFVKKNVSSLEQAEGSDYVRFESAYKHCESYTLAFLTGGGVTPSSLF